jgi:hypothetical protein
MGFGKFGTQAAPAARAAVATAAGPAPSGFKRGAPAAGARPAKAAAPKASRWAGLDVGDSREPMLEVGVYRLRVVSCEKNVHPVKHTESFKATVEVADAAEGAGTQVGDTCAIVSMLFTVPGQKDMGRFIIAAAGYDAEGFAAEHSDGRFIDAVLGDLPGEENPILGRLVDVEVRRAKDVVDKTSGVPTGDWYRSYNFQPVPEEEQDAVQ